MAGPSGRPRLVSVAATPLDDDDSRAPDAARAPTRDVTVLSLGAQLFEDIAATQSGIALIYLALDRLVGELHLEDAALVIEDPELGRQVFRSGRRGLREDEVRLVDAPPGLYTSPPMPQTAFDASLLASLSLVAVRLDLQRHDSAHDPLTGLYARGTFTRMLDTAIARSRRYGWRFALVLIDVDDLKKLNDTQGHQAGDAALRMLAQHLQRTLRLSDEAARIGGDEFALILPETGADQVERLFERMGRIDDQSMPSFSYGSAFCPTDATEAGTLLEQADKRLYEAKRRRVH